ncbi:MAG: hypothetical protein Q8P67_22185 [archaeon]|nr:hypothetical protein [archaeon]
MAASLIKSLFGEYFELIFVGFNWSSLDIDMFGGEAKLGEIELRTEILMELIDIPFIRVKRAALSGLSIKYSYETPTFLFPLIFPFLSSFFIQNNHFLLLFFFTD